ncbi:hypothetical protein BaRGS_00023165, partial [Batillaria attramentaria]
QATQKLLTWMKQLKNPNRSGLQDPDEPKRAERVEQEQATQKLLTWMKQLKTPNQTGLQDPDKPKRAERVEQEKSARRPSLLLQARSELSADGEVKILLHCQFQSLVQASCRNGIKVITCSCCIDSFFLSLARGSKMGSLKYFCTAALFLASVVQKGGAREPDVDVGVCDPQVRLTLFWFTALFLASVVQKGGAREPDVDVGVCDPQVRLTLFWFTALFLASVVQKGGAREPDVDVGVCDPQVRLTLFWFTALFLASVVQKGGAREPDVDVGVCDPQVRLTLFWFTALFLASVVQKGGAREPDVDVGVCDPQVRLTLFWFTTLFLASVVQKGGAREPDVDVGVCDPQVRLTLFWFTALFLASVVQKGGAREPDVDVGVCDPQVRLTLFWFTALFLASVVQKGGAREPDVDVGVCDPQVRLTLFWFTALFLASVVQKGGAREPDVDVGVCDPQVRLTLFWFTALFLASVVQKGGAREPDVDVGVCDPQVRLTLFWFTALFLASVVQKGGAREPDVDVGVCDPQVRLTLFWFTALFLASVVQKGGAREPDVDVGVCDPQVRLTLFWFTALFLASVVQKGGAREPDVDVGGCDPQVRLTLFWFTALFLASVVQKGGAREPDVDVGVCDPQVRLTLFWFTALFLASVVQKGGAREPDVDVGVCDPQVRLTLFWFTALFLASVVQKGGAREPDVDVGGCDPQGLQSSGWCPMTRNLESDDYNCNIQKIQNCDHVNLVGEDTVCLLVDDPGVKFVCKSGKWTIPGTDNYHVRPKRLGAVAAMVIPMVVSGVISLGTTVCLVYCPRPGSGAQNKPPSFDSCPNDIRVSAPAGKTDSVVSWDKPTASDPEQKSLTPKLIRGLQPGSTFPEGVTPISYTVEDNQGLRDFCYFIVTITVKECDSPPYLRDGTRTCTARNIHGSVCTHKCDRGYELAGNAAVTCMENQNWNSAFPACRVYPDHCSVVCNPGYQHSGSYYVTCREDATWTSPDPCKDVEPPKFPNGCPPNQQLSSGPLQAPVLVTWADPDYTENSGGNVTFSSAPARGSSLAYGIFTAKKCQALSAPSNGRLACTGGYVEGSECTVSCNQGYEVQGDATLECLNTELWNVSLPTCEDTEPPQFDNGCPDNIEVFASRLGDPTLVQWNLPVVSDNSGDQPQLTSDVPSGSEFQVGMTWVTYTATDTRNNSRSCRFSVTVSTLSCDAPNLEPPGSNKRLMMYTCPDGHVYGATCTLACNYGYPLVGADTITCEQDNTTYPPTGLWKWTGTSKFPPVCRENNCTKLEAPRNGALTCYPGNFGWDCLMSCQSNWDVPSKTDGHFYCTNSNNYWTPSTVPDCIVRIRPGQVAMNLDVFYFSDSCNTSETELKENFLERMNSAPWRYDKPCELQNIQVSCGLNRRKREAEHGQGFVSHFLDYVSGLLSRKRRQAARYHVVMRFQIVMPYDEGTSTAQETYQALQNMSKEIFSELTSAARAGVLNFGQLTTDDAYPIGYPRIEIQCPNGTIFRQRDNTVSYSCKCEACPVGSFTELDNATSCTPCPPGWSTPTNGSTNSSDCKELCPAGKLSTNSFVPCQPCPPGRYQSSVGAMTCDPCPAGTWTAAVGSTSIDQCVPADAHISNRTLTSDVMGQWSELTATGWFVAAVNSITRITFTVDATGFDPVSLTVYSGNVSAGDKPRNGSRSVSLEVESETWFRVLFVVDPENGQTSVYYRSTQVLSYDHASFSPPRPATLTIEAKNGKVIASGLHASNKTTHGNVPSQAAVCAGENSDNILTWSPNPASVVFPSECDAVDECEAEPCGLHPCENLAGGFLCHCQDGWINGNWSVWEQWTDCSATCGGGVRTRERACNNPQPQHGGDECEGTSEEKETCNVDLCPGKDFHGGWDEWAEWTPCTVTCGNGTQSRERTCTNPVPANGGTNCSGLSSETQPCNTHVCPECPSLIRPSGLRVVCSETGPPYLKSCNATCIGAQVSAATIPQYTCGEETDYLWSHQKDASSSTILPDTCRPATTATGASLSIDVVLDVGCDDNTASAVRHGVEENSVAAVPCMQQSKCQTVISTSCNASGSSGRHRRSAGNLVVSASMTSVFGQNTLLELKYAEFIALADVSAAALIGNDTHNVFTVTVGKQTVTPDYASLTYAAQLRCPPGSGLVELVCDSLNPTMEPPSGENSTRRQDMGEENKGEDSDNVTTVLAAVLATLAATRPRRSARYASTTKQGHLNTASGPVSPSARKSQSCRRQ